MKDEHRIAFEHMLSLLPEGQPLDVPLHSIPQEQWAAGPLHDILELCGIDDPFFEAGDVAKAVSLWAISLEQFLTNIAPIVAKALIAGFEDNVITLAKSGEDILKQLSPRKAEAWHMASCIPGEAGELFDAVKKHVIYNGTINRENVVEELGDLEFYMQGLRSLLGISREETLVANRVKLAKRYGTNYSDAKAQTRADKA